VSLGIVGFSLEFNVFVNLLRKNTSLHARILALRISDDAGGKDISKGGGLNTDDAILEK
jgi:hypothetical protein